MSGKLPFKRALKYAFYCSVVWGIFYCFLSFAQNNYYDMQAWGLYRHDDMRWFYYKVLLTSVLFIPLSLLVVALWRCSRNIQTQEQFLLARISLFIVFITLLVSYSLVLFFIYAFTPS